MFLPPWFGLFLQWKDSVHTWSIWIYCCLHSLSFCSLPGFVDQLALSCVSIALSYDTEVSASSSTHPCWALSLLHALPLSLPFPFTLSIPVCSREPPIRNYVKTGSSPGAHLKAVLLTCSEILTAIIIAYKSLRKFNYTKISWWKCASWHMGRRI